MEKVILVNDQDQEIGAMEKIEAHQKGELHRAFSIMLFNSKGDVLLQKRAQSKYHSGGLWTNACCSHPTPYETIQETLERRLMEEMGIAKTQLKFAYKFLYRIELDKGLIEHELDHVYVGTFDEKPNINPMEVEDYKYMSLEKIKKELKQKPEHYTYWFNTIITQFPFKHS